MAHGLTLQFKKLVQNACAPLRSSPSAAGYDLFCAETITIPARGKGVVKTGIAIAIPENCYGRIASRSGLAVKHSLDTGAGVIDSDYRGEIMVLLFNHSDVDYTINAGDRCAQIIIEPVVYPVVQEVKELDETVRGFGGFGSTGY